GDRVLEPRPSSHVLIDIPDDSVLQEKPQPGRTDADHVRQDASQVIRDILLDVLIPRNPSYLDAHSRVKGFKTGNDHILNRLSRRVLGKVLQHDPKQRTLLRGGAKPA